jgi:hypothetical protein
MSEVKEVIPEPPVMIKVEDDSTPIEKVVPKPVVPPAPSPPQVPKQRPPPVQAYKPTPPSVEKVDKYQKDNKTVISAAFVGGLVVVLSSPIFKSILEKFVPKFSSGPMSYIIIFLIAAILFTVFQKYN